MIENLWVVVEIYFKLFRNFFQRAQETQTKTSISITGSLVLYNIVLGLW
jgi:hypothetical protein